MLESLRLALHPHFHLLWNLFLALVPLVLSLYLFRRTDRRGWLWWPLLVAFVAFLPNAAYTATDIIHFINEVRDNEPLLPEWSVVYIVIPKYVAFMLLGFQCHVISLIRAGNYLRWVAHKAWVFPMEIVLNFLCAIGVYWGRMLRFNSWDIVSNPQKLADQVLANLSNKYTVPHMLWYFVAITSMYFVFKLIDVAVWDYWQRWRLQMKFPVHVMAWIPKRPGAAVDRDSPPS